MAEHRWDTAPSASRLNPPWPASGAAEQEPPPVSIAEDPPGEADAPGNVPAPRRWMMSFRAAALAVCLLVGITAGLAVFKGAGADTEVSSVDLAADGPEAGDPSAGTGTGSAADADGNGAAGGPAGSGAGAEGASRSEPTGIPPESAAGESPTGPSILVIHVAGAVGRPGVVQVPSGSRTVDAVDAAGGAAADADLTAVNLAAPLQDGMMVIVPRVGETLENPAPVAAPPAGEAAGNGTGPGGTRGTASIPGSGALVNINLASLQELDALPRVGPVIAQRIIDWRADHGKFSRPEDLDAVPGIGEAMLAALLPLIAV